MAASYLSVRRRAGRASLAQDDPLGKRRLPELFIVGRLPVHPRRVVDEKRTRWRSKRTLIEPNFSSQAIVGQHADCERYLDLVGALLLKRNQRLRVVRMALIRPDIVTVLFNVIVIRVPEPRDYQPDHGVDV